VEQVTRRAVSAEETRQASRRWWDDAADAYQAEHGDFLGAARFVWGPEGLDEADAGLLGDVRGARVLEVGCGAAQAARWLADQGARPVGVDLSAGQLRHAQTLAGRTGIVVPLVQADATALPFADGSFDLAVSAYGAVPFAADQVALHTEVARVLRPGGRWAFSVSHPLRWALPDSPDEDGLVVRHSYFDRTPYVEQDESGRPTYVEHHRTLGDRVRDLTASGFVLVDLVEPEWPAWNDQVWGGWSPRRGRLVPGTAIFVCRRR